MGICNDLAAVPDQGQKPHPEVQKGIANNKLVRCKLELSPPSSYLNHI